MTNREAAAELRARGLSLRLIGEALGVTTEGARQLLLPLPPRVCPGCGKPMPVEGVGRPRYCRAPCLPPSAASKTRTGRPVGRPKNPETAGLPSPPRKRGRSRKGQPPDDPRPRSERDED